mgnify:CR=1 FL=1
MSKSIISEGNTTNHAIENGLKELNVTRDMVDIKVLEEEKRSFFSILAPRVVKVQLTIKENVQNDKETRKNKAKIEKLSTEEQDVAYTNVENFLKDFVKNLPEGTEYSIEKSETDLKVSLNNHDLGYLIGYRGETLYAMQNIISSIASKGIEHRVRVILDIEGYKNKREKTLQDLADKVARKVIKTRKSVTLEPMKAYERKIIHSHLQESTKVQTKSIGEEPNRRIVISLKNN